VGVLAIDGVGSDRFPKGGNLINMRYVAVISSSLLGDLQLDRAALCAMISAFTLGRVADYRMYGTL
jgi:hypothetical protein